MRKATLRYFLVFTGFMLLLSPTYGQVSDAKDEGQNRLKLREFRRQIKFMADVRDYEGIGEVRSQVKVASDSTKVLAFTEEENLLMGYMVREYQPILNKLASWPQNQYLSSRYDLQGPPEDGLLEHLLDVAVLDSVQLLSEIDRTNLASYQQAFLQLHLRAFLSQNPNSTITEEGLKNWGQSYLDRFAPSPFDPYVKRKIRRKYVHNDWGATVGLGAARGTFQGEFGKLVRFNVPILIDLEVNYKKMIAGLHLTIGEGTVKRDFEYDGFWDRGLKVNPAYGGLYFGYLLDVRPFRIIPYFDIGATVITIAEQDLTADNEGQDFGAFTHGPGISLDFMSPFSWSGFDNEVYRLGLRFKGGVLFNNLKNKHPLFESHYPYLGVSLILDFVGTGLDL